MKKRFNSDELMAELTEGSAFFRRPAPQPTPPPEPPAPVAVPEPVSPPPPKPDGAASPRDTVIPRHRDTIPDTVVSRNHDTAPDTAVPQGEVVVPAAPLIERTRRAVKKLGKEAATHRFTVDEKNTLKKIEHEYDLKGIRTSENEITRIAINYMTEDYRINKDASILAKVLELLHS
jgi:hypothetical protein